MVFSALSAWKQPLESLHLVFQHMNFVLTPKSTAPEAAVEMSLTAKPRGPSRLGPGKLTWQVWKKSSDAFQHAFNLGH